MPDIRYAFRSLRKSPGFTITAIAVLALGIGANTAVFSLVNTLLLRPLPYADADSLVEMAELNAKQRAVPVSYPNFLDWSRQNAVFEKLAAAAVFPANLKGDEGVERVQTAFVTADFFAVFQVKPALGRTFTPEDDSAGAGPVAMLSNEAWLARFGGDPGAIGKTIALEGQSHTVIGVLPPSFRFYRPAEIFVPYARCIRTYHMEARENHSNTFAIGRLKAGVTLQRAKGDMAAIAKRLEAEYPASNTGFGVRLTALREHLTGNSRKPALMLFAAVGIVLLIGCVNLANLLLARSAQRTKEIAIRAALGAGRGQIAWQLIAESLLLSAAGGAAGLALAKMGLAALLPLAPAAGVAGGLHLDVRVLAFTAAISILTGLLFGLAPSIRASKADLVESLKQGCRGSSGAGNRLRRALVIAEVALASALLCGAGLLLRSLSNLTRVDPGFDAERVLTMKISLPRGGNANLQRGVRFYEELVERVGLLPGVAHAGVASSLAFTGEFSAAPFYALDRPVPARGHFPEISHHVVSPGYFKAMGIPLRGGRIFDAGDGRIGDFRPEQMREWFSQAVLTVVLSESAAREFWPGEDPVGRQLRMGTPEMNGPRLTVAGVVGDTKQQGLDAAGRPELYFSSLQFPRSDLSLVLRASGDPAALVRAVRLEVSRLNPEAPVMRVRTMEQMIAATVAPRRSNLILIGVFAAVALALAGIGLYGLMSNLAGQRGREFGVRMAVGAAPGQIVGMVLREGLVLAFAGAAAGIAGALACSRLIESMLFGVTATDPLTYGAVGCVLLAIGAAGTAIPAMRACRVDPVSALRAE